MNKTIGSIILGTGVLFGATATTVIKYKSIQVSDQAKTKIVNVSKILKLSQRETATELIS